MNKFLNTYAIFLSLIFLGLLFFYKDKKSLIYFLIAIFLSLVISVFLKELFLVPRPFLVDLKIPSGGLAYSSSFPSTHSTLAFSSAVFAKNHSKNLFYIFLIIAIILSLLRVSANTHYFLDIIGGMMIGISIALFVDRWHSQ